MGLIKDRLPSLGVSSVKKMRLTKHPDIYPIKKEK